MAATGRPAPFRLGAPAYVAALGGWVAAAALLLASAPELTRGTMSADTVVGAAHAVGLVVFPFAVAAAVWQLLPVMLRNDPPRPWLRWAVLSLLAAGVPLTVGLASGRDALAAGVVVASTAAARVGAVLLLASALVALACGAETVRRAAGGSPLTPARDVVSAPGLRAHGGRVERRSARKLACASVGASPWGAWGGAFQYVKAR